MRHDRNDRLRFAPLASEKAAALIGRPGHAAPAEALAGDSIVVVRDSEGAEQDVLTRTDAVAALLDELPQPWPAAAAVLLSIPRPVRDWGYRLVARWRSRLGGGAESCPLPTAEERSRLL